jgi:hypothetical protein
MQFSIINKKRFHVPLRYFVWKSAISVHRECPKSTFEQMQNQVFSTRWSVLGTRWYSLHSLLIVLFQKLMFTNDSPTPSFHKRIQLSLPKKSNNFKFDQIYIKYY